MDFLYKKEENKIIYLDELGLEKSNSNLDFSIYEKFIQKYSNKILEKEPLGLCDLEKIFFLFPYSLGFGYPKTNISKLIQIAKTGDLEYCKKVFDLIKNQTLDFAKKYDAIVFVPYSVERKCNFLTLLQEYLSENYINIIKSFRVKPGNEIKNIKSIKEKFRVATEKFDIEEISDKIIKNILIIDDMANTGASMCAIANKIKNKNIKIDGFSIVGSLSNEIVSDI